MRKSKLHKYAELDTFENCLQDPETIKGKWHEQYFKNNNPITLELGCGKGEYTIALAERFKTRNFIGADIKGARLWRGCKIALEKELRNVAFLRIQIDHIIDYFEKDEVSEIWLTFPDPQPKKEKKRLTAINFVEKYQCFLKKGCIVHLKTDDLNLYEYTLEVIKGHNLELIDNTDDLYNSAILNDPLTIKTTYEQKFLEIGQTIKYIGFKL
ncbi:tRNA (guanosine(46)-N7)-methyltransferase TrmB [Candidatus Amoebophilus asiaticus]|nr:tRNA (guanosine(46)-N7)-methyltransferase TrmB [Candidatus Amoebophilus asiaticus]